MASSGASSSRSTLGKIAIPTALVAAAATVLLPIASPAQAVTPDTTGTPSRSASSPSPAVPSVPNMAAPTPVTTTTPATASAPETRGDLTGRRLSVWVSPTGSDSAAGTERAPFRSLERARDEIRKRSPRISTRNAVVNLKGGTYPLTQPFKLTSQDSGSSAHPVIYRAAPGEKPVLSGSVRAPRKQWERTNSRYNIWRVKVGKLNTRQLYVNGRRAVRARTTDYPAGFRPTWANGGKSSGIQYLPTIKPSGLNPANWGNPAKWTNVDDIDAVILSQWKMTSVPLKSATPPRGGANGLLKVASPAWKNANVFRGSNGQPGMWSFWQVTRFENARQFLDQAGEWYLDQHTGWLYYSPRAGENLKRSNVDIPIQEKLVSGVGTRSKPVQHLSFEGITFSNATWLQPSGPQGYVTDQSGFHLVGSDNPTNITGHNRYDQRTPGNVSFEYGRDLTFTNNTFRHLGAVGLDLQTGSQGNTVRGNSFTDISSAAVQLGGISKADHHPTYASQVTKNNVIAANTINGVAAEFSDAAGIYVGFSAHTQVLGNTISNVPWSGIAAGWGWGLLDTSGYPGVPGAKRYEWGHFSKPTPNRNSVFANNTITNYAQQLWDAGAIYTTGQQGTSMSDALVISGNKASNKTLDRGTNTLYTDGGSRFIKIKDNVLFQNPIGHMNYGPKPQVGDPLPYPAIYSDANILPYGGDIGGCRTYGDISYTNNKWFQNPMIGDIILDSLVWDLAHIDAWSDDGFFQPCAFTMDSVSHPTRMTYSGNTIYPN